MKCYQAIRKLTVAPFLATVFLFLLRIYQPSVFANMFQWITAVICLGILPLLAYPLQPCLPHFKNQGRRGQRQLAIFFSVAGYIFRMYLKSALPEIRRRLGYLSAISALRRCNFDPWKRISSDRQRTHLRCRRTGNAAPLFRSLLAKRSHAGVCRAGLERQYPNQTAYRLTAFRRLSCFLLHCSDSMVCFLTIK